ncbi:MAG: CRISPR-associated CARF protein Csa3 [Thermoprotei archaeon]
MRVFLTPIGFHEDVVLRLLKDNRASTSDKLLVFTCRDPSSGTKRAYESLRASCIKEGYPEPQLVLLNCSNVYEGLSEAISTLATCRGSEFILEIGAGLRIIGYLLLLALLWLREHFTIHYEPEGSVFESTIIPYEVFHEILEPVRGAEKEVLMLVIREPGITVKEASTILGKKEKTIRNLVTILKRKGLVEKESRSEKLYPTNLAKTLYTIHAQNQDSKT